MAVAALAAIVVGTIIRISGWSDEFSYAFSLTMLGVLILVCFPFVDWGKYDTRNR